MVTKDKQWWTFEVLRLSDTHNINQSFALPPPPNQSVIWLSLFHCVTVSPYHCMRFPYHHITASPHHCMRFPYHCVTMSLHHHVSQSFALPPATKPVSHLTFPLPLCHHVTTWDFPTTASLHHCVTASLHHHVTTWDVPHHIGMNLIG